MKIYTKTGDGGDTGLVGGRRVGKHSQRIVAIGEVDELNACLGWAAVEGFLEEELLRVQCWLFDIGAELAGAAEGRFISVSKPQIEYLESSIDAQSDQLPPLREFILPGGSESSARLHLARSVCRRAERAVLALNRIEPVREDVRVFLNRLSDWLFVCARTANSSAGVEERKWKEFEG